MILFMSEPRTEMWNSFKKKMKRLKNIEKYKGGANCISFFLIVASALQYIYNIYNNNIYNNTNNNNNTNTNNNNNNSTNKLTAIYILIIIIIIIIIIKERNIQYLVLITY